VRTRDIILRVSVLLLVVAAPCPGREDDDTGAQPGFTLDFGGGKRLNKVGTSLSYSYPLTDVLTLRLTSVQNINNRPEDESESDTRKLRTDLEYSIGKESRLTAYYEQQDSFSDNEKAQQSVSSQSHRAGSRASLNVSEPLKLDLGANFLFSRVKEESYEYFFDFIDREYDQLSADAQLTATSDITDNTRLVVDLQGSRELRDYPDQPLLNSEYYSGLFSSTLTGSYMIRPGINFDLNYTFSGQLHRDLLLIERDQNSYSYSLSASSGINIPWDTKLSLSGDYSLSTNSYLNEDVWLNKYYYLIYPELHPIPEYRNKTPLSPLYNTENASWGWQVKVDFDPEGNEHHLHWSISQQQTDRRYFDDADDPPPERFSVAGSLYTYYKNTMSTDAQLQFPGGFVFNLRHSVALDSYQYIIATDRDWSKLANNIRSSIKWRLTDNTSLDTGISLRLEQRSSALGYSLPRANRIEMTFGGETKVADGVKIGYALTIERYNQREEDFQSGQDSLSRELSLEPTFNFSEFWNIKVNGTFSEKINFPVGGYSGSVGLRQTSKLDSILNLLPSPKLTFQLRYTWNYSTSEYTTTTYSSTHDWNLEFSYNLLSDLILSCTVGYFLDEYDTEDNDLSVGLTLRSTLF
jgi:hypothetical protein